MHVGNASTALLAWLSIRARDGRLVMRMEDLDRPRVRPDAAERILSDLVWYCFVSGTVAYGKRFLNDRGYRIMVGVCAVFIVAFGIYFGWKGFGRVFMA